MSYNSALDAEIKLQFFLLLKFYLLTFFITKSIILQKFEKISPEILHADSHSFSNVDPYPHEKGAYPKNLTFCLRQIF